MLALACVAVALLPAGPAAARQRRVAPAARIHAHPAKRTHRHGRARRRRARPVLPQNRARARARKAAAIRRYRRHRGRTAPARPRGKAAIFNSLNAVGIPQTDGSPSDSTGAIGPAQYVEFTNGRISVYDRSTMAQLSTAVQDVFMGVSGDSTGDPQIQWDPVSSRWYYLGYDDSGSTPYHLAFGWSKTSSPTDLTSAGWCTFTLSTGTLFPDFPKLGHDNTHLIFGVNSFDLSDPNQEVFATSQIFALPKPANGDTTCPASAPTATSFGSAASPLQTSNSHDAFTPVPANTTDSSSVGYVVSADDPNALMAWHIGGTPTVPTLTADGDMSVAAFSIPAPATQPGTTNLLDTLNGQLLNAVARSDPGASGKEAVWTQHAIDGPGGRSVVRWYEVIPADLNVRQQGTISDPSSFVFNGAISPAGNGQDAVIEYSASGPSLKPSIRASAHRAAGTLGSTGFPITIVTSAFSFDDFTCIGQFQPCRWGDYSGASPDPLNSDVVWGTNQYSGGQVSGGDAWATRNFAVQVQPGGPTAAVSASPGTVNTGQTVNFDGSTSADTEAQIVDYRWDLDGNGTFETDTGSTRTVSRSYATAGTVNPRLRVTDANGDHNDSATTVTVNAPPPPPPPQPSAACLAARAKRDQLAKTVKALKKRLAKAKKASAKRRYRKTLARRKAQLKQAQKAATQLCP